MIDRKEEETTSRLYAAESKLCTLGRRLPTAWRCQICNLSQPKRFAEAGSSARCLQNHRLGLLVKQCRHQPGSGLRQAEWRHGFAAVQNPCICPRWQKVLYKKISLAERLLKCSLTFEFQGDDAV